MSGILCAIRGGPSSHPTISASIQLAQQTGETIYFPYVVNLDFLTHSSSSKTNHISQELHEMGEFILSSAQEQATEAGAQAEVEDPFLLSLDRSSHGRQWLINRRFCQYDHRRYCRTGRI